MPQSVLYSEAIEENPNWDWVVMVHGAGGSVRTWKYQLEAFKGKFNLLLMDLRDHGLSQDMVPPADGKYTFELMAQDIEELMQTRGISKAHFVGVSMGSIVIRWMEHLYPERVASVVLAGGVFGLNWKLRWGLQFGLVLTRLVSFRVMGRILSRIILPRPNHQKARRIFLREADRIAPQAFRRWIEMARRVGKDLGLFFRTEMSVPALAVMGAQDHVFLPPAKAYAQQFAGTQLEIIPRCGHVCSIENAPAFNRVALAFLQKNVAHPEAAKVLAPS